ncbi:MAG: 1-acyl-sn-glycerol-3-phosphate acyltransferase [Candidatus Jettenia ecosi]|uniref:1-acyl-sn-glycerol-3-phosphate acyltransferase n=1 Tax=Candidatus Jettenia ecosi TaxID=2494326 RepID=A0A533QDW5_9BACT|nr:MAG: 1-acyl-sn-glycerol-3-phosphate acyltransferase [Candidatus Jettenia ecosi]
MDRKLNKNLSIFPVIKGRLRGIYFILRLFTVYLMDLLNNCFFLVLKVVGVILLRILYHIQVENKAWIPLKGPLIVAANHFSYMDPVVLQAMFPRRIIFMMTEQFYEGRWKWLFKLFRCICVRKKGTNIAALREGIEVLRKNNVLGIYPEGGVSKEGQFQEGNPGIGFLVKKSNAPVVPAFISGTYEALPKGAKIPRIFKIKVVFGKPMTFEKIKGTTKEEIEEITRKIMEQIKKLSPSKRESSLAEYS